MRVLHLSDLHFGYDKDKTESEKRSNCMNKLLDSIEQINEEKSIDYLVISGDVAYHAAIKEYELAGNYIKDICQKINLPIDNLIICPGNHDIDRNIAIHDRVPSTFEEADELYRVEDLSAISRSFTNFETFCTSLGLKPSVLRPGSDGTPSYLVGLKAFENINFVILNSSWASISDKYDDKMWIGNNFVETIIASKLIDPTKVTITIMHHPEKSINNMEQTYHDGTNNTYNEIQKFSDLILCGHSHETKVEPKPSIHGGYTVACGATYIGSGYRNCIVCYDISNKESVDIIPYLYDHNEWKKITCDTYKLGKESKIISSPINASTISVYRQLLDLGFRIENCQESDFCTSGTIIWPVVPRKNVTHIHQAQIELMSVMSNLFDWRVRVVISNCGSKSKRVTDVQLKNFIDKIKNLLEKRKVKVDGIDYLSRFFEPSYEKASEIFNRFINISSNIQKVQLTELKNKKYNDGIQKENDYLPVLDYILPLLQMSVVCHLGSEIHNVSKSKKTLIVAGNDESNQWKYVCRENAGDCLGALLIPNLRDDGNTDSWQTGIRQYLSAAELEEDIKKGNFGFWCYCMFIKLQLLNDEDRISDFNLPNEKLEYWRNNTFIFPKDIDDQMFVEEVWKTIGLAI